MNVLVLGSGGQLGRALLETIPGAVGLDRAVLDVRKADHVSRSIGAYSPTIVINTAAYTAVDQAERHAAEAHAVNDSAVGALAAACAAQGAKLVHISTDFVFDGEQSKPYRADDLPNPINVYGASKLAGERKIQSVENLDWRIVRTAWVYSACGKNFLLTMLRLFRERDRVEVVADQVGTPTSAKSLAQCVWQAAQDEGPPAILHYTDAGVASWYDFAVAIYEEARALRLITRDVEIVPIATAQYPTAARRPPYSVLDKSETLRRLNMTPVHWRVNLREVLREMSS